MPAVFLPTLEQLRNTPGYPVVVFEVSCRQGFHLWSNSQQWLGCLIMWSICNVTHDQLLPGSSQPIESIGSTEDEIGYLQTHIYIFTQTHSGSVWKVTWAHPEFGQVLASCSFDRTVAIWEEQGKSQILTYHNRLPCSLFKYLKYQPWRVLLWFFGKV